MRYDVKQMRADIKAAEEKNRTIQPLLREEERLRVRYFRSWGSGDFKTYEREWQEYRKAHPEMFQGMSAADLTLLYSARAHVRGRLHIQKRWVPCSSTWDWTKPRSERRGDHEGHKPQECPGHGRKLVHYTLEDQVKAVAPLLQKYNRPEGVEPSPAHLIRVAALPLS